MQTQIVQNSDNLQIVLQAIDNQVKLQKSTKHQYRKAVTNYVAAGNSLTDAQQLTDYALTVGSSTRSFLRATVGIFCKAIEQEAKSNATPQNIAMVQATIYRAEALLAAVEVEAHEGEKGHTWLSESEVAALYQACKTRKSGNAEADIVARRDKLAIGLLVTAGLRRLEAVNLTFADMVKLQDKNGNTRYVLNVTGKGAKDRVIPLNSTITKAILELHAVIGDGRILRSLGRNKQLGESMSSTALYQLVQKRGTIAGFVKLQPHDLRRSYAQIGYKNGVPITQLSILLGHASIQTTMTYLNIRLNLVKTVSDYVPF